MEMRYCGKGTSEKVKYRSVRQMTATEACIAMRRQPPRRNRPVCPYILRPVQSASIDHPRRSDAQGSVLLPSPGELAA
jgi:hypothetical protein